jgi:hypothetical protein
MEIDSYLVNIIPYRPRFRVGDIIEIIGNIPFDLKNNPSPILGRIISIDGFYIYVRPKYQRYVCEFYANEIIKH